MPESEVDTVPEEGNEPGRRRLLPLIAVAIVTLGVGAAVGAKAVGPKLGTALASRAEARQSEKKETAPVAMHVVDNLVVNPAASGGSRFLLTSIALQAAGPDQAAILKARDVEIRDAFVKLLSSQTVEQLTDMSQRSKLSKELMAAANRVVGAGTVTGIYIPQFVIQ